MGVPGSEANVILLTGPNMGGKSTMLRQVCIAVIMAQLGSYVPASSCRLSPVDRIFTRLGASDNIFEKQSTFMVELQETATVLNCATEHSLIILDELGRGTSTFDGYSIAFAVLEELARRNCRLLFSTHYHMLTQEFHEDPRISLQHMDALVDSGNGDDVVFLFKMKQGICPKSYGMKVAQMAGLSDNIREEATRKAQQLESISTMGVFGTHTRRQREEKNHEALLRALLSGDKQQILACWNTAKRHTTITSPEK